MSLTAQLKGCTKQLSLSGNWADIPSSLFSIDLRFVAILSCMMISGSNFNVYAAEEERFFFLLAMEYHFPQAAIHTL